MQGAAVAYTYRNRMREEGVIKKKERKKWGGYREGQICRIFIICFFASKTS